MDDSVFNGLIRELNNTSKFLLNVYSVSSTEELYGYYDNYITTINTLNDLFNNIDRVSPDYQHLLDTYLDFLKINNLRFKHMESQFKVNLKESCNKIVSDFPDLLLEAC